MTDSTKRPLKVFLCHASADKPAVRKLYRYLRSKGMDPWLDVEKLLPGQRWEAEIPKALYASDAIIVFLSKNSTTKEGYVQREIKFALDKALDMPEGRIFLIPARLEECELPESLKGYQWVDLFQKNWNRRLMSSLNERAAQLGLTLLSTTGEIQPPVITTSVMSQASHAQFLSPEVEESPIEAKPHAQEVTREKVEPEAVEKPAMRIVPLSEPERNLGDSAARGKSDRDANEKLAREKEERKAGTRDERESEKIFSVSQRRLSYLKYWERLDRKSVV